jgi:hypothetical protein
MVEIRIPLAGLVLGLATGTTYGMLLAVIAGNLIPILLAPVGAAIGWWLGVRRERRLLLLDVEEFVRQAGPQSNL